jgi:hypothetical protein
MHCRPSLHILISPLIRAHLDHPGRACVFVNAGDMFEVLHSGTKAALQHHSLKAVLNHAFEHLHIRSVVKVAPKVILVVRPTYEWPNQFAQ